jgi:hypothetical protein
MLYFYEQGLQKPMSAPRFPRRSGKARSLTIGLRRSRQTAPLTQSVSGHQNFRLQVKKYWDAAYGFSNNSPCRPHP